MRVLKKFFFAALLLVLVGILAAFAYYFTVTAGAKLESDKLALSESFAEVFDAENEKTAEISFLGSDKKVRLSEVPESVRFAFIAAEDKKFYSHHGLDYARMVKAAVKNLGAHSFRQGASTISQQLVKNTHLTNEKTLKRKLKEIRLTRKLEKAYSKDEILEMYLNTIYFGHSCYGIAGAADYYFGKAVNELTPAEGAMLAAIIRSPNNYSPFVNAERCLAARNGVLKKMREQGYISESDFEKAVAEPLPQKRENAISSRSYLQCVSAELEELSELYSPYRFLRGLKIYTYMDADAQNYAENLKTDADRSGKSIVIIDNKTRGIAAWYTTEGNIRRQPGSLFKPLAVYAPAIEENIISPCTPVADEKTNFGGYAPSNYKDVYRGYISVRQALSESVNVPAVKILSELGIAESEKYLAKMGFTLQGNDKNLSLALGGLSEGFTLQQLAGAYTLFANEGRYASPAFIRKVEDSNGNTLYERKLQERRVFSEDTVLLINDILKDAAKTGTAKKLASLPFSVCAKTGTCGADDGNTDAYTVAYTGSHTVGVWMGNADNARTSITGGGLPCHYAMLICKHLYSGKTPAPFALCESVEEARLDKTAYDKDHRVLLAPPNAPKKYTFTEYFRKGTAPKDTGMTFAEPSLQASIAYKNNRIYIDICQTEYYDIIIKRINNGKERTVYEGNARAYTDTDIRSNEKYRYTVTPYFTTDAGEKIYGKAIELPTVYTKRSSSEKNRSEDYGNWWETFCI